MMKNDGRYRPNHVIATLLVASGILILLLGQSLWIPASRINDLHVRSIVLALADSGAALASAVGADSFVPGLRQSFLELSGLSENASWDTRYFNRRGGDDPLSVVSRDIVASSVSAASSAAVASAEARPADDSGPDLTISDELPPDAGATVQVSTPTVAAPPAEPAGNIIHSTKNPLSVYMFGDSQVFSLGSGLSRIAGKDSPVNVEFLAIHSSGFIRKDYYNWPAKLTDALRSNSYNAAVMMLGMNDYQSFWNSRGEILKKRTPEWEAAYKDKCRELIDVALCFVPRLYWIGMPVVKNTAYNESLSYIDSVQQSLADEYSPDVLVRISLSETIPGKDKEFTDSIDMGGGKMLQVMSADGSHYTVEGGELVMQPLFDRLAHDFLFTEVPVAHRPG